MGSFRVDWHGSFAVIVTPFTEDGDVDEGVYREVVDLVIDAGCHGVISGGSTGEFFLMTGRVPVVAGTSAIRAEDVVDLTRHAGEAGCAGAMVLPPILPQAGRP